MTEREQQTAFERDLDKLVERYVQEFQMSTGSAVGVLQILIHRLIQAAMDED